MGRALAAGACIEPLFDNAEQALADKRAGVVSEAFWHLFCGIITALVLCLA